MSLQPLFERLNQEVLATCGSVEKSIFLLKSPPNSQLRHCASKYSNWYTLEFDAGTDLDQSCNELRFSTSALDTCGSNSAWQHPYWPVSVEIDGDIELSRVREVEQLRTLMLYDLCRFVSNSELNLRIKLCSKVACNLLNPTLVSSSDRQVLLAVSASASVFIHTIRVTGDCKRLRANYEQADCTKSAQISLTFLKGDHQNVIVRLHTFEYRLNDEEFAKQLEQCLDQATKATSPVILCTLLNEIDISEWYLRMQSSQRDRLPSHEIVQVKVRSARDQLKIRIAVSNSTKDGQYRLTPVMSADEALFEFKDDRLLGTAIPMYQQFSAKGAFKLHCFTVPCRTTLRLMEAATELQGSLDESKAADKAHSAAHQPVSAFEGLQGLSDSMEVDDFVETNHQNCRTELLIAVENGRTDLAQKLLARGANCIQPDHSGTSALTKAVISGNEAMVKLLLESESGSSFLQADWPQFASHYDLAWTAQRRNICALLIGMKLHLNQDSIRESVRLSTLVSLGKSAELKAALLENVNCHSGHNSEATLRSNYRDWRLRTPLMWAALGNWKPTESHAECAAILLNANADPNAADKEGNTPLHLAAASSNAKVVQLLLGAGAAAVARNLNEETPLMMAEKGGKNGVDSELVLALAKSELQHLLVQLLGCTAQSTAAEQIKLIQQMIELLEKIKKAELHSPIRENERSGEEAVTDEPDNNDRVSFAGFDTIFFTPENIEDIYPSWPVMTFTKDFDGLMPRHFIDDRGQDCSPEASYETSKLAFAELGEVSTAA